ncbi:PREDICTED: biotin carboxyl carrier protein of acetyl-CoA carboxylase 2, chloroplastic-like [Nelumbo nucifera]|uniref:Biotin carboxyl carrier protein of acetyl-CoA carboxylase n=1 Tax=Nelumbo nucifera TaxID=4432 RepID=A0A1U8A3J6_NELNU|nr:PREDICTED: biotin carboxyl carrier protein of acetyl-CoA carboxylase 2, chloroplastic-like [Nelumbo nucifera]
MATFSVSGPKSSAFALCRPRPQNSHHQHPKISFHSASISSSPSLLAGSSLEQHSFSRPQGPSQDRSIVWKVQAQLNEVIVEKSSNSTPLPEAILEIPSSAEQQESVNSALQSTAPDPSSISAFMNQVADLVKLVDSQDIMELQLKQLDCELIIRKKEALPRPTTESPFVMMQPPLPQVMLSSQFPPTQAMAPASASSSSSPVQALPSPPKTSKSSHPPLKSPMAGTFYQSPAPGEPPFVKVGDKVQKGQVVCIIEAMKLMNEIEADQSGTVVEVLVENGKPVSLDTPLFVIEP